MTVLTPPMPWFGSKRQAARQVWAHLGDPACYMEPFAGSIAVLLARPDAPRMEVIADADPYLINFWRCLRTDEGQAHLAAHRLGPISESEIEAWHRSLIGRREFVTRNLAEDVDWFSPVDALRWWIGVSSWIGSGWCTSEDPTRVAQQRPHVDSTLKGAMAERMSSDRLAALSERLRRVVMVGGDWRRGVSDGIVNRFLPKRGGVGIFLDPPYTESTGRATGLYVADSSLSADVESFALRAAERGCRVVVAGYETEYPELTAAGWAIESWSTPSGYVNRSGNERRATDVLMLSPLSG